MKFTKPIDQIIQERYSARTFTTEPLTEKELEQIRAVLETDNKGPFGNAIRLEFLDSQDYFQGKKVRIGTYGLVKNTRYFIIGIMNKENLNLKDFGYLFEEMILKMTDLNFGTVWLGKSFNDNLITNLVDLKETEVIPAITPVGHIAEKKSLREKIIAFTIGARKRKPWEKLFFKTNFTTPLDPKTTGKYKLPLEMVRLAPSARNLQPWRILHLDNNFHFYLHSRRTIKSMAGLSYMDIGITVCHFELTALIANLSGQWDVDNPQVTSQPTSYEYIVTWSSK
jgi:hypothetical protein